MAYTSKVIRSDIIEIKDEPSDKPVDDDICELEHLRKLFIGGLAPYTTEEGLKEFYGQWGKVVDVVVMRDPATKRSRGFGFITYTKSSMVDTAQENRPHIIDGKTVEAKRALPRPERESRETNISVKKLFVGGLKDNHDENCLHEYFSQFGKVLSIKILTDKTTGKRRGFAFIEYDDYDAVDKAILQKTHSIKYVVVDVKKSIYNQEMQKHNKDVFAAMNSQQSKQPLKDHKSMQNHNYRPQPPQPMPSYQPPPPMNSGPPPPNYYWGPPPPSMPQYGGYQQPPNQQMNNWNYPPAPQNGWNAGPPPPGGPPPNWYPNQWGPPPGPPPPMPVGAAQPPPPNWNMPPGTAPPVPPPGAPNSGPPQQQPPQNFGSGYQQNYGGGPAKHNMNSNRMNPYSVPPNNYGNNMPHQHPPSGYGGYSGPTTNGKLGSNMNNGPGPVPKPMINGSVAGLSGVNKFRR